tara:strand:- start:772 stop:1086 length:315 start_codon:yes stop_codon:yes gene_type:complete
MENWKKFLTEGELGAELVKLRLSRVDHDRLASVGAAVAELGPGVAPMSWNINNSVLAVVDDEGGHWFLRPHHEDQVDKIGIALNSLERMGFKQSDRVPVPVWRN